MVMVQDLDAVLREHAFFAGLDEGYRALVAGCAANEVFPAGAYIYKEGAPADKFYLVRFGKVAIEVYVPGKAPIIVETLTGGDLMGWSWLLPPYRCQFDARAVELARLISLDAACLRGKMEGDPVLGYALYKRFAPVIAARMAAARRQMIDMYGHPGR